MEDSKAKLNARNACERAYDPFEINVSYVRGEQLVGFAESNMLRVVNAFSSKGEAGCGLGKALMEKLRMKLALSFLIMLTELRM